MRARDLIMEGFMSKMNKIQETADEAMKEVEPEKAPVSNPQNEKLSKETRSFARLRDSSFMPVRTSLATNVKK